VILLGGGKPQNRILRR